MSITPATEDDESIASKTRVTRRSLPATDALGEAVAYAMTNWRATLRLCCIGLAFSLPAAAVITLVLFTR